MPTFFLALLLAAVLSFFCLGIQKSARNVFQERPAAVWAVPILLTGVFTAAAALVHAASWALMLLVLIYTTAPVLSSWFARQSSIAGPTALDFLAILLLWLPLEFAAGARLVPHPAQGFLHSVAYGIGILLGLLLFLGFRAFPGLKYELPRRARDAWLPLAGFAASAPVLALLGVWMRFVPPPHAPSQNAGSMAASVGLIFIATALPEEILFRSLIQNLLMQRFGAGWRTLLVASLIFGCAHLDNGPQPQPNWRYMILATIAGVAYGAVFQRSSSVISSAGLHMLVDWTKHAFF